ncbi:MAG: RtcB family protein [Lachnospiraceae bacterium]|nr:RtcB family protein [Lachnospiraceae bacterium]
MSDLKIFTDNIEPEALNQIYTLIKQPAFVDCKVRIMPDVHAGAGCVIGFTADLGDKVIPNIVGVDIGCGMYCVELGKIGIDLAKLDEVIRKYVPSGRNVHEEEDKFTEDIINQLYCKNELKNISWLKRSCGTLGGGNHFVEVDIDEDGNKYLIIHSGSRNIGKQAAEIYQQLTIDTLQGKDKLAEESQKLIEDYKITGKHKDIQRGLAELKRKFQPEKLNIPKKLSYLTGENREKYLHDMKLCQEFATENRHRIAKEISDGMGWQMLCVTDFETIHNYIEHDTNIVRKGAISAKEGEKVLIPMNMRDGCIIGIGKGNVDWNYSAPHGAGRIMSRSKARENVSLEEFERSMKGIYTTSVNQLTIDESPMAYKPMEEIVANIQDTVEILKIIKPIYNFKASK